MKKIYIFNSILAVLLLTSVSLYAQKFVSSIARQDATHLTVAGEDRAKNFLNTGGSQTIQVTTNLVLHAKSGETWCVPAVNQGTKEVSITVGENTGNNVRTAEVTVYGKDNKSVVIEITQLGTQPNILVNETGFDVDQYTTRLSIGISSNIAFSFDLPAWISVPSTIPAIGFSKYEFTLAPIDEGEVRE